MPARENARSTSAGDSGCTRAPPKRRAIRSVSSTSRRGGPPPADGSPEQVDAAPRRARRLATAARRAPSRPRPARRPTRPRPAAGTAPARSVLAIRATWSAYRYDASTASQRIEVLGAGRSSKSASCAGRIGIRPATDRRAPAGPWRRARSAAKRPRLAPPPVVPEQQRLGELEVVAPCHPDARPAAAAGRRRPSTPTPSAARRPAPASPRLGGEVGDRGGRTGRRARLVESAQPPRTVLARGDRYQHHRILRPTPVVLRATIAGFRQIVESNCAMYRMATFSTRAPSRPRELAVPLQ